MGQVLVDPATQRNAYFAYHENLLLSLLWGNSLLEEYLKDDVHLIHENEVSTITFGAINYSDLIDCQNIF